jgi:hypothetical protein
MEEFFQVAWYKILKEIIYIGNALFFLLCYRQQLFVGFIIINRGPMIEGNHISLLFRTIVILVETFQNLFSQTIKLND